MKFVEMTYLLFAQIASMHDTPAFLQEIPRFPKYECILPDGHRVPKQQVYQLTNGIISKLTRPHNFCSHKQTLTAQLMFSLGLFICNGGRILTVVLALTDMISAVRHSIVCIVVAIAQTFVFATNTKRNVA